MRCLTKRKYIDQKFGKTKSIQFFINDTAEKMTNSKNVKTWRWIFWGFFDKNYSEIDMPIFKGLQDSSMNAYLASKKPIIDYDHQVPTERLS